MAFKTPKNPKNMSDEKIAARVQKMLLMRAKYLNDINNFHVRLMEGNSKTGEDCYTVSLIPIADCKNCSQCRKKCYDILNVCFIPAVQEVRAQMSAIHKADIDRFWNEVALQVRANNVKELRGNVGGDYDYEDFIRIRDTFKELPECDFLFFTKSYDDLNQYISENIDTYPDNFGFPKNVHPIWSVWPDMEGDNIYGVPESHILWPDGSTTAPEYGAYYCGGNCSDCHKWKEGCWNLKKDESVIFGSH